TLDMFLTSPLKIGGEVELRIEQHLLGMMPGLENVERICAHQQSLAQCRGWLREYLPHAELIGVSSNAAGARRARDEKGTAAIGGEIAAEVYDLKVLVNNIEDSADNSTRFLVIGRQLLSPSGDDKTTILVSTSGTAGAGVLHTLLQPFSTYGINMTRIESRPSRKKNWDYVFFIDLEGHAEDASLKSALTELEKNSSLFRIVGAYPKAVK
ncbi:MAG: prephenate dehydratase domain-containing protein, partial [Woeseiaceae bacterium]